MVCACDPRAAEAKVAGPRGLLGSQPSILGEFQISERACLKKKQLGSTWGRTPEIILSLCTHAHLQPHAHKTSHTHTHTQFSSSLQPYSLTQERTQGSVRLFFVWQQLGWLHSDNDCSWNVYSSCWSLCHLEWHDKEAGAPLSIGPRLCLTGLGFLYDSWIPGEKRSEWLRQKLQFLQDVAGRRATLEQSLKFTAKLRGKFCFCFLAHTCYILCINLRIFKKYLQIQNHLLKGPSLQPSLPYILSVLTLSHC